MNLRRQELLDVLSHVRKGREALRRGQLHEAVYQYGKAERGLAFVKGLFAQQVDVLATATLARLIHRLGCAVEEAVRPSQACPHEVIQAIAEGLLVLRTRDGVGITDAQVQERARNIAAGLIGAFDIREPAALSTANPQLGSAGSHCGTQTLAQMSVPRGT